MLNQEEMLKEIADTTKKMMEEAFGKPVKSICIPLNMDDGTIDEIITTFKDGETYSLKVRVNGQDNQDYMEELKEIQHNRYRS